MAPTIAEMATITYTLDTRKRVQEAISAAAEALLALGRAVADSVSTALQGLARALSGPAAPAVRSHSHPGVDASFTHRGRRR